MSTRSKAPVDLDLLTSLAKRFANLEMYDEAGHLFELALRMDPGNKGVQLGLAQIRHLRSEAETQQLRTTEQEIREQFRRNAIDACHFFGLAALYWEREKPKLASECLEIALSKEPIHPFAYKLQGKLLIGSRRWNDAYDALRTAKRFNPFDRQISELLGQVEHARGNVEEALESYIDAFLLLEEERHPHEVERLKERIQAMKNELGLRGAQLAACYRERRIKLQTDFDRLELQRERFHSETGPMEDEDDERESGRILLAARLRDVHLWRRLNDAQVFQLTRVAREELYPDGAPIFHYGDQGGDLFLIAEGEVSIGRPTPYGKFVLAKLPSGTLFGEVNFLSRAERSGDATAVGRVKIVRILADELEELMHEKPELGVRMYFCFWQGLAEKLRSANEQMRTFFDNEEERARAERPTSADSEVDLDEDQSVKVAVLQERGLSGSELDVLAQFSNTKRYDSGSFLFHEGDPGNEMYVILEGKVMISKYIPGGGEEALAILERGDFFGEMSLVDGAPRSADAKAYQGAVTVVAFDELTLREVQQTDANASIEFIRLLCQMMSQRLREVDEKVTSWRIMSGQRPDQDDQISFDFPADLPAALADTA